MNNKLERMKMEEAVAYFKVFSQNFPTVTEGTYENPVRLVSFLAVIQSRCLMNICQDCCCLINGSCYSLVEHSC